MTQGRKPQRPRPNGPPPPPVQPQFHNISYGPDPLGVTIIAVGILTIVYVVGMALR